MYTLSDKLSNQSKFAIGVELVTTRGTMVDVQAVRVRSFATQLVHCDRIDWVSITDNAGGNPQLSPMALGKPILYGGKEVLIHLSCKDFNRNGLESEAWQLASEGFHNILALSGDYSATGFHGRAKPVFDIDSIGLLTMLGEMNRGSAHASDFGSKALQPRLATNFFVGAVTTNFKRHENEVVPQLLKLEKKVACGARFIIAQIGFDARKSHELLCYMQRRGIGHIPLIGNVFLLSPSVLNFFRGKSIPGVVVSNELMSECRRYFNGPDRGRRFFIELAAKQLAIFRGLGFAGGYLGGVHSLESVQAILDIESSFAEDDWKVFAREIRYPVHDEFHYFAEDPATGCADASQLHPSYASSLTSREKSHNVTICYRFSKWIHEVIFTPGRRLYEWARTVFASSANEKQGPLILRILEKSSKSTLFNCKDCGDCSLPDIAFLCPESQCAKNQRNGPCGGTRDGKCEVDDFECIWSRAYDRLKYEGLEQNLLDHAPVIQDESLRGTSSWANALLGKDHHSKRIDIFTNTFTFVTPDPMTQPSANENPINDHCATNQIAKPAGSAASQAAL